MHLFEWVLETTWQASVVALLILAIHAVCRDRISPGWRYGLWLLLVARLLLPTLPESSVSVYNLATWEKAAPEAPSATVERIEPSPAIKTFAPLAEPAAVEPPPRLTKTALEPAAPPSYTPAAIAPEREAGPESRPISWRFAGFVIWVCGMALFALRLLWSNVRFSAAIRRGRRVGDAEVLTILERCRESLQVKGAVALVETDWVETPSAYGFGPRKILLPRGFLARFTGAELRYVLTHELAHIRRRDLEMSWVVAILQTVHWFNPLLWLAFARMRVDRELATDALTLKAVGNQRSEQYGETILKVLAGFSRKAEVSQLVGIVESKARIAERLRALARYGMVRPYTGLAIGVASALACLTLTGAVDQTKEKGEALDIRKSLTKNAPPRLEHSEPVSTEKKFAVQTVDFESEAPVSGVVIQMEMEDYVGNSLSKTMTTGEDGRASLPIPQDKLKSFSYRTEHPEFLSVGSTWEHQKVRQIPETVTVKMTEGREIGGVIADPEGKPITGAEIYFDRPIWLILSQEMSFRSEPGKVLATSGKDGRWAARCLWPRASFAHLRVRHPGYADEVFSTDLARSNEPEQPAEWISWTSLSNQTAVLTMRPGISVRGLVRDETGKGLPGIVIQYSDRKLRYEWEAASMGRANIITDGEGRFQIGNLPKKRIYFTVQAPGFAPRMAEMEAGADEEELGIELTRGKPLKLTVKDTAGNALPGVKVRFLTWSIWQGVQFEAVSDSEGRIEWANAPEEKFSLEFEAEGFIPMERILQGGEEKQIQLKRTLRLAGEVTNSETGEKVERFRIFWDDSEDKLAYARSKAIEGAGGSYRVDLGRIHADGWADHYFHRFILRVEADGYEPAQTRLFESRNDFGEVRHDFKLKPSGVKGLVVDAKGEPVGGAQIALRTPTARLRLAGKPRLEELDKIPFPESETDGTFLISLDPAATHLLAVHEKGFAVVEAKEVKDGMRVQLQPWGRIEGVVKQYGTPLAKEGVVLGSRMFPMNPPHSMIPFVHFQGETDSAGRYRFEYVPPTNVYVYRAIKQGRGTVSGPMQHVELAPGERSMVDIGGSGRQVVGRFKIKNPYVAVNWADGFHHARTEQLRPPGELKTREEYQKWSEQPEVKRALLEMKSFPIQIGPDGSFKIEEVVPGKYEFTISLRDPTDPDAFAYSRYIANYHGKFEVPDDGSTTPLDVGEFEIQLKGGPGGGAAPELAAMDLSEKEVQLSDLRGKYVLLDFWATWCSPCIAEMPYLKKVQERFGGRKDFVLVGVSMDKSLGDAEEFAKRNGMNWTQWFLPQTAREGVQAAYDFHGIPAKFLIDPEGKLVDAHLDAVGLTATLEKILPK